VHQREHLRGLEQEILPRVPLRIFGEYQIRHFVRVLHRILPAAQAGGTECLDTVRMLFQFMFRGEQIVAIKINSRRTRV